jgi:lysyl-tRNA synthetase class 1
LAGLLKDAPWQDDALQVVVFNAARLTPIEQPVAFKALYRVLLDRDNGPKAGNLLSFLDREFVIKRCQELPLDNAKFWEETTVAVDAIEQWLAKEKDNVSAVSTKAETLPDGRGVLEFYATLNNGKTQCRRTILSHASDAGKFCTELEQKTGLKISN